MFYTNGWTTMVYNGEAEVLSYEKKKQIPYSHEHF